MNEASQNDRLDPDLEARIVALVLGEASELERDQLNRLIEQRPELAAVKKQFESIDGLMRDVSSDEAPPEDEDWKLPAERRHKVLAAISGQAKQTGDAQPRLPTSHFWNATRVAISLGIAGLFLMLATGAFMMQESRQVGSVATDMQRDFAADFDVEESASVEFEASIDEEYLFEDEYAVSGAGRRFRGSQLARPAKPQSGVTFGDTADSKSSLSAIRDSLGVDAIKKEAVPPSAYYLQDDVQYFPTVPSPPLPEVAAAADKSGAINGQAFPSKDKWSEVEASPEFAAGGMKRFDDGIERSGQVAKAAPQAATRFGRGITDFETAQRGEPTQRPDDQNGAAGAALGFQSGAGGGMGGGGFGGGIGGEPFGSTASPQQGLAEGSDPMMAGMELMEGMSMMGEATVPPANRPGSGRFYESDALSYSIPAPESAPEAVVPEAMLRELEERSDLAVTAPAEQKHFLDTPKIVIPQEEEPALLETRALSRRTRAAIAGKTVTLSDLQSTPSKPVTQWGAGMNELDGLATADRSKKLQDLQSGLQRQAGQVASKGKDDYLFGDPQVNFETESLKRSSIEKSPVPDGLDEKDAASEAFSTFSLHVSDVSFKLAAAALARGEWPEPAKIRIEEFVNALDYGDPMPSQDEKVACRLEQAIHPFLQQRNLLRVSMRTAAAGRASNTPLRLTFLLDNSGSMERIDRQQTVRRAFALLAQQLKPLDQVTLISFARQPRLLADKVDGSQAQRLVELIDNLPSEGGTNIEAALQLAFEKAREHQTDGAQNRIILLTDGAVNLGNADPESLSGRITTIREAGIAFDAAGIVAEGLNDEILEALTRKGDGRYYLLDSPDDADDGFASQIAGALRPSAKNVKVQIEFNPKRVGHYKLLGFEKHLLKKEDFRNDKVDAAEMAAAEAGVAVYQFQAKPDGEGDVGSVSVRFQDLSTGQMIENRWPIPYEPNAPRPDQASESIRIATAAALFAAKLRGDPLGANVDLKTLSDLLAGLPDQDRNRKRVQQLQMMISQARQLVGN
ncbi:von Willebrand factor type A domain-containing protein [Stieleria sp.]|uniref:YfbK domain-containing protein n=1 Tax=Stieleria sp. TaxID=2795976 RepID=UPI003561B0BA